jgi:hypothetical protein
MVISMISTESCSYLLVREVEYPWPVCGVSQNLPLSSQLGDRRECEAQLTPSASKTADEEDGHRKNEQSSMANT